MKYKIYYKRSVVKDFRKFSKNQAQRQKFKKEIESILTENPFQGKKLKAEYQGLYSLHVKYKFIVVYKILKDSVFVLAVESRESGYKKTYTS
jgi:addiction module RelE/StbE family toxin